MRLRFENESACGGDSSRIECQRCGLTLAVSVGVVATLKADRIASFCRDVLAGHECREAKPVAVTLDAAELLVEHGERDQSLARAEWGKRDLAALALQMVREVA